MRFAISTKNKDAIIAVIKLEAIPKTNMTTATKTGNGTELVRPLIALFIVAFP